MQTERERTLPNVYFSLHAPLRPAGDKRPRLFCYSDEPAETGAVFVFGKDVGGPGNWGELKVLTASDGADYYSFGSNLSLTGNKLYVGSYGWGGIPGKFGAVYLFELPVGCRVGSFQKVVPNVELLFRLLDAGV